jgi:hypothetical protein
MKMRWLSWLLWGWGTVALLSAQNAVSPRVDFEFSVMASDRMSNIGYAQLKPEALSKPRPVAADYDIIPLRISSQGRGDLHRYQGRMPLRLVEIEQAGEGGWRAKRMVGSVNENSVPPRALILLQPDQVDTSKLHTTLLDDTEAGFPVGHVRVVNLSRVPVEGQLNDTAFATDAVRRLLPPQSVGTRARVGVVYAKRGRPVVVFDQSLRLAANERVMLVFLPPFRAGADVRVRVVRDQLHVPDSEE